MSATAIERRTALYRFFDADGALLYVGISCQPEVRFTQHAADKAWWPQVARTEVVWYDDRLAAAAAEAQSILNESPLWNIATPDEDGRYTIGTGRPPWADATDEQSAMLAAIDTAVNEANQITAKAEEAKAKADAEAAAIVRRAIEEARGLGVPMREVVKRVGRGRATIYRRLGKGEKEG